MLCRLIGTRSYERATPLQMGALEEQHAALNRSKASADSELAAAQARLAAADGQLAEMRGLHADLARELSHKLELLATQERELGVLRNASAGSCHAVGELETRCQAVRATPPHCASTCALAGHHANFAAPERSHLPCLLLL